MICAAFSMQYMYIIHNIACRSDGGFFAGIPEA